MRALKILLYVAALPESLAAFAFLFLLLAAMLLGSCHPAYAGDVYGYTTPDGVVSFTDDLRMVPPMYRAQVKVAELTGLENYSKLTVSHPYRFNTLRLERLRLQNATASARASARVSHPSGLALPITSTREMQWLEGVSGYSGARYVSVDVLRDGNGRTIAAALSDIGNVPGALVVGGGLR